jgi:lysozyme family protein
MTVPLTDTLRAEYQNLFDTCEVNADRQNEVAGLAASITQHRSRYEAVGTPLAIPWFFIGVIHNMESSQRFDRHLHNGDPLTARTVHVPPGRPKSGDPPFTWELSATDALILEGLDKVTDWRLPALLYQIEKYNGFGYRTRHPDVLSPYLWSGSQHYTRGKFVADGTFDPDAVSKQSGAGVILQHMVNQGEFSLAEAAPVN